MKTPLRDIAINRFTATELIRLAMRKRDEDGDSDSEDDDDDEEENDKAADDEVSLMKTMTATVKMMTTLTKKKMTKQRTMR